MPRITRTVAVAATALLVSVAGVAAARSAAADEPSIVELVGDTVYFRSAAGLANTVAVDTSTITGEVQISDVHPITVGAGCRGVPNRLAVLCPAEPGRVTLDISTVDGDDTVTKSSLHSSRIDAGAGNDTVHAGPTWVSGPQSGLNIVLGGPGRDDVVGGPSRDQIDGGIDADTLRGGAGVDEVSYSTRAERVYIDLTGGITSGAQGEGDRISEFEDARGGSGPDWVNGDANGNVLTGGPGADTAYGRDGNDNLRGGGGGDTLFAGNGDDWLYAGDGDGNELRGEGGNDILILESRDPAAPDGNNNVAGGGEGDDAITSGRGRDQILGGPGVDTVSYSIHSKGVTVDLDGVNGDDGAPGEGDSLGSDLENLVGSPHADTLTGNAAANVIEGGAGDDYLYGLGGTDTIRANAGADHAYGGAENDVINGNSGADTLRGEDGGDQLWGGSEDDDLDGGPLHDYVNGEDGRDTCRLFDGDVLCEVRRI